MAPPPGPSRLARRAAGSISAPSWSMTRFQASLDSRVTWRNDWVSLGANYIWLGKDLDEDRTNTISEWTVDSAFVLSDAWTLELDARYDVAEDRPVRTGLGLQWKNECVTVDVSASRRYSSSSTVDPTTTFAISGSIGGFSTGRAAGGIATGCGN